jgi:outer membrane immunogenic protein
MGKLERQMKKYLLSAVSLIALATTASAADMAARPYAKAPPMAPAAVYNWTGFYIGGHVGGAFRGDNNNFGGFGVTGGNNDDGRFLGGVQVGGDYQFAGTNWVIGVEGQYSWLDRNNNGGFVFPAGPAAGFVFFHDQRAIASVTGRVGYTWGPALLYAKGGYAYADTRDSLNFGAAPFAGGFGFDGGHRDGYTVGAGLEYMFTPNWSLKGEYMYYNFERSRFVAPVVLAPFGTFRDDLHTVKLGLNYRFNWAGPVAARY